MMIKRARDYYSLFICIVLLSVSNAVRAALPPEAEKKWHEGFILDANVKAGITYLNFVFDQSPEYDHRCVAYYQVVSIKQQPDDLGLQLGDQLLLSYPCTDDGFWSWVGSTLPWVSRDEQNMLMMQIPAKYLVADGTYCWQINNASFVFAPVFDTVVSTSPVEKEDP